MMELFFYNENKSFFCSGMAYLLVRRRLQIVYTN